MTAVSPESQLASSETAIVGDAGTNHIKLESKVTRDSYKGPPAGTNHIMLESKVTRDSYKGPPVICEVQEQRKQNLLEEVSSEDPLDKFKNLNKELVEIKLKDESKEVNVPNNIPYNIRDVEEFQEETEKLLKMGIIHESKSPHSAPAFYVENHNELKRKKRRMLRLHENTKGLTAFSCPPQKHYEWNVMPFSCPPQRFMDKNFNGMDKYCLVYIDDIIVFSETKEEHMIHVKKVLERVKEVGIILSALKSKILKTEIEYLGLEIGKHGVIKLAPHTQEKIMLFPDKLEDRKQIQRFLGCINYIADQGFSKKFRKILRNIEVFYKRKFQKKLLGHGGKKIQMQ
ncbi:reverse transcriptase [Artemisia annua]|uniref:RNA-directed DNA polymerase n=1 Tax=Artemisia annua TaxID=35608 RepID=A0A2U1KY85_ARTAN|nr:reverse transcriptase [Artemisia annua]